MTETSTSAAPIRLSTDDDPEPQTEDQDLDALEALDALAGDDFAEDEDPFDDLDSILEAEEFERVGKWESWPAIPGARVKIAHFSACVERKRDLENRLRSRKGWTYDKKPKLNPQVDERLWRESMFNTVVRGWEGIPYKGKELPFTEKNYRRMIQTRRFRAFVFDRCQDSERIRKAMEEDAGKS